MSFFFSSRRRHTRYWRDWIQTCALPICVQVEPEGEADVEWDSAPVDAARLERHRTHHGMAGAVPELGERKRVEGGKGGDLGGRRICKKKKSNVGETRRAEKAGKTLFYSL